MTKSSIEQRAMDYAANCVMAQQTQIDFKGVISGH